MGEKSEVLDWDLFSTLGLNPRPIIGVLAQGLPHSLVDVFAESNKTTYIGAAYVKYLESAGARVVPVLLDQVCILSRYLLNASFDLHKNTGFITVSFLTYWLSSYKIIVQHLIISVYLERCLPSQRWLISGV